MQRIGARMFAGFQMGFSCAAHIVARPTRSGNKAVCKDAVCSWCFVAKEQFIKWEAS